MTQLLHRSGARPRLAALAVVACAACALALPAAASALPTQLTMIQDDPQFLYHGGVRTSRLDEVKALGVSIIKVRLSWRYIAPRGRRRPRHFDATNPAAYPAGAWSPFDALVRAASSRGLIVFFQLGGSAPAWATHGGSVSNPNPREFKQFVQAAGTRYSGSYQGLPRVSLWSVWNEANLASWLAPQYHGNVPASPAIYRSLLYAASDGLNASGHAGDQLLIGELLPFARSGRTGNTKVRPITFLRELACVDGHFHPYTGRAAAARGCTHFRPIPGTGLAYHPYTLAGGPNVPFPNPDDASIENLGRVTRTLDALSRRGRLQSRQMPLWITEFGFQTRPPDPFETPIRRVPDFLGQSEWLAFHNPRVVSWSQYPLVDDPTSRHSSFSGFHSGIRFHNGRPKPGVYQAFHLPLWVRKLSGSRVEIFGALRGARYPTTATIQSKPMRGGSFTNVASVLLNQRGYFDLVVNVGGAAHRVFRFQAGGATSRAGSPH